MQPQRSGRRTSWWTALFLAGLHAALAACFLNAGPPGTTAACTGLPLDDAWIHMVYGRAVATTGLPCYNAGVPEAGFTSPLWMLVCAIAHWLALVGLNAVVALKLLGTASGWLMSLGTFALTTRLADSRLAGLIAATLTALTPLLAYSQVAGMEVCLAAACGLWALHAWLHARRWTAGLLLALAFWSRPEMVLLVGVLTFMVALVQRGEGGRKLLRSLTPVFLPALAAAAIWSLYCLAVAGSPLPNTFHVKFDQAHPDGLLTVLLDILWPLPVNVAGIGILLWLLGAWRLGRAHTACALTVLFFPWLFFVATALTRHLPLGDGRYFYWARYAAPALPLLLMPIGVGWDWLWRTGARHPLAQAPAAILLAALLIAVPRPLFDETQVYAADCRLIDDLQVRLGHWVAENVPADAGVAVSDAGAIRYIGNRRTIDLIGLNDHTLLPRDRRARITGSPAGLHAFLRAAHATHLIVFPAWFAEAVATADAEPHFRAVLTLPPTPDPASPAPRIQLVVYEVLP